MPERPVTGASHRALSILAVNHAGKTNEVPWFESWISLFLPPCRTLGAGRGDIFYGRITAMRRMLCTFKWEYLVIKAAVPAIAVGMWAGAASAWADGGAPAAPTTPAATAADAVEVNVVENARERVAIECTVRDFTRESVDINGRAYSRVVLDNERVMNQDVGAPELPQVRREVIIPNDARMEARVVSSNYYEIDGIDLVPSRGSAPSVNTPYTFGKVYEKDAFYPGMPVTLAPPYILRDYRGVTVELNPFQYNPVTRVLRVYTDMSVEVVKTGTGQVNLKNRPFRPDDVSLAFHRIYADHFINYASETRFTPQGETGDMLIICPDSWLANVKPLVDYQRANHVNTKVVGVSRTGNSSSSIKEYVHNSYNHRDLAFVLLIGDSSRLPDSTALGGAGDTAYGWLDGTDEYPEILIGRLAAESAAQVDARISRAIGMGTVTVADQPWFKDGGN